MNTTTFVLAVSIFVVFHDDFKNREAVDKYVREKECSLIANGSLGDFYRYVNNKTVNRSGVATLKGENGELIADDCGKAVRLNSFFSSVFTDDDGVLPDSGVC